MKKVILVFGIAVTIYACSGGGSPSSGAASPTGTEETANPAYDPERGAGKFTKVDVGSTLNAELAAAGQKAYEVKCSACHKLTEEKLVGPGWKGVTSRHKPEWIMNFATNTDEMLQKDAKAQAMLEVCLVRMPNQHLTDEDARNVYEFMRKNDGVK